MITPKVSVVIPVYNAEPFLEECLNSLISQTLNDIEIICVDDGSTDNSFAILSTYSVKDSRIKVLKQENSGAGTARNNGMATAGGDYIIFLDADDYFDRQMLELTYEKALRDNADIVLFDIYTLDNVTKEVRSPELFLNHAYIPEQEIFNWRDIPNYIFNISSITVWNKLFRRDFINTHNIKFQQIKNNDANYFASIALIKAERISILDKRLMYFRQNNPSSQTQNTAANPLNSFVAWKAVKDKLVEEGLYEKVKRSFVNRITGHLLDRLSLMNNGSAFELLYNKLRNEYFETLDITGHDESYFYNRQDYVRSRKIIEQTAAEYLFERIEYLKRSAYSAQSGFVFPRGKVNKDERIVLYGAGNVGQSFYRQIVNTGCCELVLWVDRNFKNLDSQVANPEIIKETSYDKIVIAVADKQMADSIKRYLLDLGVDDDRIIWEDPRLL